MSKPHSSEPYKPEFLSSFGRRIGRPLGSVQQKLADEMLPKLRISLPSDGMIDLEALFGRNAPVHLEIGFGAGEHLVGRALAQPEVNFIGCEPFINGVGKLLESMSEHHITNIRLYTDDARLLLKHLPKSSIEQFYILFPDPWRKPRHHKRRIVNQEMLTTLAELQPKGAQLLLATDHENYKAWMCEHILASPDYEWKAQCAADWNEPPAGWVPTRYQQKTTRQGRKPLFLECERV